MSKLDKNKIHVGLTDEEVKKSREEHGENKIIEKAPPTFFDRFKETFEDDMNKTLIAMALILGGFSLFGLIDLREPVGIVCTLMLIGLISARSAMANDEAFVNLKKSIQKARSKAYRNGAIVEVDSDDLVVGDMVILQSGDKIPADGILVDGAIKVDNSALNGESEECKKFAVDDDYEYEDKPITGDTFVDNHSLFKEAVICNGEGVAELKKVGMNTMMGKMAEEMNEDEVDSPLTVKLSHLALQISKFGYIGSAVIALGLLFANVIGAGGISEYLSSGLVYVIKDIIDIVVVAVTIIVMAVPEGLPLMIAVVLAKNSSMMYKNNVLVRKSIGIETAGSLNILFSDKTGTITKGELEVVEFFDGNLNDSYKDDSKVKEIMKLCIGKNTGAMFDNEGKILGGNATDKALLQFLGKEEMKTLETIATVKTQGFNSANKYSASQLDSKITVYKGAPERLLAKATKMIDENGNVIDINKDKINEKIDSLAEKAMRVLSFAYSESDLVEDTLPEDLVIVGFVGIRDDVRQEAKEAIKEVQDAGVQVVMITGDRKETAIAIAKESGLLTNEKHIALTSEELNKMSDDEIKAILSNLRVIARALPTDKSRMVRIAQELNLVCGMTGDGVNDSPALKRADVGFAMGSGTDVAKEASDIIIVDDNFKSIASSILYGRTIYNNILKFIKFQLTINVTAVGVCAIAPFVGVHEPLKITHMLWLNLIMDTLGALALGSEPALKKYMKEKPKSRTQALVSKKMFGQVLFAGAWLTVLSFVFLKTPLFVDMFDNETAHSTAYFSFFVLSAIFNGFNVRSEGLNLFEHISENKGFIKVMSTIALIQVAVTLVGGEFFSCEPFGLTEWLVITALAFTIIPVDMLRKVITKSK